MSKAITFPLRAIADKLVLAHQPLSDRQQAVAGRASLVARSHPAPIAKDSPDSDGLYPRTVVATDRAGKTLWLIIVDGRQPFTARG